MKAEELILKTAAGKLEWWEAAEIMSVTPDLLTLSAYHSLKKGSCAGCYGHRPFPAKAVRIYSQLDTAREVARWSRINLAWPVIIGPL